MAISAAFLLFLDNCIVLAINARRSRNMDAGGHGCKISGIANKAACFILQFVLANYQRISIIRVRAYYIRLVTYNI